MACSLPIRDGLEVYRERPLPVSWKVPAFCTNDWAALTVAGMCEAAGAGRPFEVAYGAPECAWAGGRPAAVRRRLSEDEMERYFQAYGRFGVRVALTLSRLEVGEGALDDPYCELLLDVAARNGAEAIVADDALAGHIRSRHPEMRLIASFNKPLCELDPHASPEEETAYYRRLLGLYDEVVVRCEYALDDGRIGLLGEGERPRAEVIVNQICVPNCPVGRRHMRALEDWDGRGPCQGCFHVPAAHAPERRLAQNLYVSSRRIDQLAAMGVSKMKIGGRNAPVPRFLDLLATYVFEPTGAILAMKEAAGHEFARARADPRFTPCSLPEDVRQ